MKQDSMPIVMDRIIKRPAKNLMRQNNIMVMDGDKCILQLIGLRQFLSDKFDITKYKNYMLLDVYDKKNVFYIEDYINRKGEVKLN